MQVSTSNYEFTHGKKPRGYGQWAFFFDGESAPFWYTGSYAEAKKMAIRYAVSKGHHLIAVGS